MNSEIKKIDPRIAKALETLPTEKREFIIGYAEGILAASTDQQLQQQTR